MPTLARLIIKTGLCYLAAAMLIGIALTPPFLDRIPSLGYLSASQIHLLVLGWLTQLIFGVAFWLFPRHSKARPFGYTAIAWSGYVVLNAGLLLRLGTEPILRLSSAPALPTLVIVSAVLQWLGCLLFAVYTWTRVRSR